MEGASWWLQRDPPSPLGLFSGCSDGKYGPLADFLVLLRNSGGCLFWVRVPILTLLLPLLICRVTLGRLPNLPGHSNDPHLLKGCFFLLFVCVAQTGLTRKILLPLPWVLLS